MSEKAIKLAFPTSKEAREKFVIHREEEQDGEKKRKKSSSSSHPSPFYWASWDLLQQIPEGFYSTYAALAEVLASSPRAVGGGKTRERKYTLPITIVVDSWRTPLTVTDISPRKSILYPNSQRHYV